MDRVCILFWPMQKVISGAIEDHLIKSFLRPLRRQLTRERCCSCSSQNRLLFWARSNESKLNDASFFALFYKQAIKVNVNFLSNLVLELSAVTGAMHDARLSAFVGPKSAKKGNQGFRTETKWKEWKITLLSLIRRHFNLPSVQIYIFYKIKKKKS